MWSFDKLKNVSRSVLKSNVDEQLAFPTEGRSAKWYIHRLDAYTPPDSQFDFKVDDPSDELNQIVERLIEYYHRLEGSAISHGLASNDDMWLFISQTHEPFRTALAAKDHALVSNMLVNAATGPLVLGFMNYEPYDRLVVKPEARVREAKHFVDKLLALSESLGCSPVQCVEQGVYGYEMIDIQTVLAGVKAKVGFDISPPLAGGGSFGFNAGANVICIKDLYAIYTANQARRLTENLAERSVAEIGGGTGTLAYYLIKAGLPRVTVFDLPIVTVLQGYYLMRSLGPEKVWLHGEAPTNAPARVQPFWTLPDEPDNSVALFINQDSLPEIEKSAAQNYLRSIRTKGVSLFLSINQEGQAPDQFSNPQSVVFRLVEENGGFEREYRFPHWMRAGYVEELYRIKS